MEGKGTLEQGSQGLRWETAILNRVDLIETMTFKQNLVRVTAVRLDLWKMSMGNSQSQSFQAANIPGIARKSV